MNPQTTAVLVTRLIGLLMILYGAAQLLGQVVPFFQFLDWLNWDTRFIFDNLSRADEFGFSVNLITTACISLAAGWYFLFRGRLVRRWLLAGLSSECPQCGYTLHGIVGPNCPECGSRISPSPTTNKQD